MPLVNAFIRVLFDMQNSIHFIEVTFKWMCSIEPVIIVHNSSMPDQANTHCQWNESRLSIPSLSMTFVKVKVRSSFLKIWSVCRLHSAYIEFHVHQRISLAEVIFIFLSCMYSVGLVHPIFFLSDKCFTSEMWLMHLMCEIWIKSEHIKTRLDFVAHGKRLQRSCTELCPRICKPLSLEVCWRFLSHYHVVCTRQQYIVVNICTMQ